MSEEPKCYRCPDESVAYCDICDKPFCADHGRKNFDSPSCGEVSFCESCGSEPEPPMDRWDEMYARARSRGWED